VPTPDELVERILADPVARARLADALAQDVEEDLRPTWWKRAEPFVAGASSALVVVLAFLLPSVQEQWEWLKTRDAVERYAEMGRHLMAQQHYASAEQAFGRALELGGNQRLDLLEAQIKARALRIYEDPTWRGRVDEAVTESDYLYLLEMEDAAGRPKDRAVTLAAYGAYLSGEDRWLESEKALREASALDASASRPHVLLGDLLVDLDRTGEAEAEYRKAISVSPDSGTARYDLALLLIDAGKLAAAEAELRAYTRSAPTDPDGHALLSDVLSKLGKQTESRIAGEAARRLDPRSAERPPEKP
jgi:tetratricopeptide (TPR) repeat protein